MSTFSGENQSFQDPHPPYLVPEPWASLYNPDDMMPGRGQPGEFDQMPPHFAETQKENPDFSAWEDVQPTHGFASHLIEESELRKSVATYYGMISFMDQQIGRILDALQRLNIEDETLVVFTTDHGHFLGQHGLTAKGPFHYEDLVRVPFIVRYPGRVPAGKTSSALQSLVDLAPTFLDAAGLPVPGLMQGISQFQTWSGAPAARDHVLVENRHQPSKVHLRTFIGERYKMTLYRDHPYGELFDLQNDPGEFCNRWADPDYQEIKAQVFHQFLNAEIKREPTRHARVGSA